MKYIIASLSILLMLGFSACGYKEGVVTHSQKSYLTFSGDTSDVEVSIDNGSHFSVESGNEHQYAIKPGKHHIEIYKNNQKIVDREIYISDEVTKEIEVR